MIRVELAAKRFAAVGDAPARLALGPVRLRLTRGERVALVGPSGAGKSTLLNLIAGLDGELDGRIERPPGLRLGYVFQAPRLLPWRTVEDNLRLVLEDDPAAEQPWLDELLAAAGLADARAVYPERLSLGMARRVAVLRAFAPRPDLVLLDEPFVSLDDATAATLRRLVATLLDRHPATMLLVTHQLAEAVELAGRVVVLTPPPGRIAAELVVPLTPTERRDPAAVERCRQALLERIERARITEHHEALTT